MFIGKRWHDFLLNWNNDTGSSLTSALAYLAHFPTTMHRMPMHYLLSRHPAAIATMDSIQLGKKRPTTSEDTTKREFSDSSDTNFIWRCHWHPRIKTSNWRSFRGKLQRLEFTITEFKLTCCLKHTHLFYKHTKKQNELCVCVNVVYRLCVRCSGS